MKRLILALLILAAGCGARNESFEPLPATAEGLAGTTWQLEDTVLAFKHPPDLEVSGKAVPGGAILPGRFIVHDGIIEITVLDRTRAGTWNGHTMVIDGVDGQRVS